MQEQACQFQSCHKCQNANHSRPRCYCHRSLAWLPHHPGKKTQALHPHVDHELPSLDLMVLPWPVSKAYSKSPCLLHLVPKMQCLASSSVSRLACSPVHQALQNSMQELGQALHIFCFETICGLTKPYHDPMVRPRCCQAYLVEDCLLLFGWILKRKSHPHKQASEQLCWVLCPAKWLETT